MPSGTLPIQTRNKCKRCIPASGEQRRPTHRHGPIRARGPAGGSPSWHGPSLWTGPVGYWKKPPVTGFLHCTHFGPFFASQAFLHLQAPVPAALPSTRTKSSALRTATTCPDAADESFVRVSYARQRWWGVGVTRGGACRQPSDRSRLSQAYRTRCIQPARRTSSSRPHPQRRRRT